MLYVHIPFCSSKCDYCDFYSGPASVNIIKRYINALISELNLRRSEIVGDFNTIYIGGGTPSSVPLELMNYLIDSISTVTDITVVKEFTVEVNPENVTRELIAFYKSKGVTRVSMGIQSFDDAELRAVGRRHGGDAARRAIEKIKSSGLLISCDLIYGLPGQTLSSWVKSLDTLLSYKPEHFSAYLLSYESGTRLTLKRDRGEITECDEDTISKMYDYLCAKSKESGYDHYEISNFGSPMHHAVHNSGYWIGNHYLGIGASAHSFTNATRKINPANRKLYCDKIESGALPYEVEYESERERFNDIIITGLRTSEGIDTTLLPMPEKKRILKCAKPFMETGSIKLCDHKLFIPECHWLVSDNIMRELIDID